MAMLNVEGPRGLLNPSRIVVTSSDDSWRELTSRGDTQDYDITKFEDYKNGDTIDTFDYMRVSLAQKGSPDASTARHYRIETYFNNNGDTFNLDTNTLENNERVKFERLTNTTFKATASEITSNRIVIGFIEFIKSAS